MTTVIVVTVVAGLLAALGLRVARPGRPRGPALAASAFAERISALSEPRLIHFAWEPVRVAGSVVIINVKTTVTGGLIELRAVMSGPVLPASAAVFPEEIRQTLPASLARSGEPVGNRPWNVPPTGKGVWQVGFVFPNATVAQEVFRKLRNAGLGTFGFGEQELFNLIAADDFIYRGSIEIGPRLAAGDPAWVSVLGESAQNEGWLRLTWVVQASYHGGVRLTEGTNSIEIPLETHAGGPLSEAVVQLDLTRLENDRVRLERTIGVSKSSEEFSGQFQELAEQMRRTAAISAKTTRTELIELCQVNGQSLTMQVIELSSPAPLPEAPQVLWAGGGIITLVVLLGIAGGVVLLALFLIRSAGVSRGLVAILAFMLTGIVLVALVLLVVVMSYWSVRQPALPRSEPARMPMIR